MTAGQIGKAASNYHAMLIKHAPNFLSDAVQAVLEDPDFAAAQLALFRERVEARSGMIVRDFAVDTTLVGMAAINATGRAKYVNGYVIENMPRATAARGKLHFFQTGRYTPVAEVEAEYCKRGLVAVDPHTLCAFNAANPEFGDAYPNATQMSNIIDSLCYIIFSRSHGEREVRVSVHQNPPSTPWGDCWWFAGVPKELSV